MTTRTLILHIATEARPEALALLPEPTAPSNYKDPGKIAEYIAQKRAERDANASLDPDLGALAGAAWMQVSEFGPEEPQSYIVDLGDSAPEDVLLRRLWAEIVSANYRVVGYNVLSFALPYILRRSLALGTPKPPAIPRDWLRRYQSGGPVFDLMTALYPNGNGDTKSLSLVSKLYGLPDELPGLDSQEATKVGGEVLRGYLLNRVQMIRALYERMAGLYFPKASADTAPAPTPVPAITRRRRPFGVRYGTVRAK